MSRAPFFRGLAALLRAGVPIREAVDSMRSDGSLPDPVLATAIANGHTLAEALERAPAAFPPGEVALVSAGEATGRLEEVLDRLAAMHDAEDRSWRAFRSQCAYPLVILHVALFCMPLALITLATGQLQIGLSVTISLVAIALVWAAIGALFLAVRDARNRAALQHALGRVPGLGGWSHHQRCAVLASVLEASHESGVTLDQGLRLAGTAADATVANAVANLVQGGMTLGEALRQEPLLPGPLSARLATAERAGELGPELRRAADEEFEAAEQSLRRLSGTLSKGFYIALVIGAVVYIFYVLSRVAGAYSSLG